MLKDMDSAVDFSNNINELVNLVRNRWGDLAPEAFAGLLSTVISDEQLASLIKSLKEEYGVTKGRQNV
jgi:hypothetical protein